MLINKLANCGRGEGKGKGGAVVSQNKQASEQGALVLKQGGNAVDAAVATAMMLGVVEPWMSGLGGGGYMLISPPDASPVLVDFNMRSPLATSIKDYPLTAGISQSLFPWTMVEGERNTQGALSICAPTAASGLELSWQKYGKMPWAELLQPAIDKARVGIEVDWYTQLAISSNTDGLASNLNAKNVYLKESGAPKATGWNALSSVNIDMGKLADTLQQIAAEGSVAITKGDIAKGLIDDVKQLGGVLSQDDFQLAAAQIREPGHCSYANNQIFSSAGLTGGATTLDIFSSLDVSNDVVLDAEYFRNFAATAIPIMKHRVTALGDSEVNENSHPSCTTHFCVTDKDGLTVSTTITLVSMFGSKVLSPQTGIMLNNAMSWFDPTPGKPNSIWAGKLCLNNMSPLIIKHADGRTTVLGAAGGRKITPAVAQLLGFILHAKLSLFDATNQPRIDVQANGSIIADSSLDSSILAALSDVGKVHQVEQTVFPNHFGIISALSNYKGDIEAVAHRFLPPAKAVVVEPSIN